MSFMTFDAPVSRPDADAGAGEPPGRHLAQVFADGLAKTGCAILEDVAQHDAYGWSFVVDGGHDDRIWCMLQLSDNWLLIVKPGASPLRRLFRTRVNTAGHERVSVALRAVAQSEPLMKNVRWFATEDDLRLG